MGDYVAFSGLIWAIANPMRQMGNIMNEFQRFSAASKKVMELYYSEPKIRDEENAVSHPERFEGKIEFDNVSFQYEDGDLPVLHNISFTGPSERDGCDHGRDRLRQDIADQSDPAVL